MWLGALALHLLLMEDHWRAGDYWIQFRECIWQGGDVMEVETDTQKLKGLMYSSWRETCKHKVYFDTEAMGFNKSMSLAVNHFLSCMYEQAVIFMSWIWKFRMLQLHLCLWIVMWWNQKKNIQVFYWMFPFPARVWFYVDRFPTCYLKEIIIKENNWFCLGLFFNYKHMQNHQEL